MTLRTTGAILSPADARDHWDSRAAAMAVPTTGIIDLSPVLPPIWDQGSEGTCVGHAVARVVAFQRRGYPASRRDGYWQARNLIGEGASPDGCHTRAALKCLQRFGVASENDPRFAYFAGQRDWAPPVDADALRAACHASTYWRQTVDLAPIAARLIASGPFVLVVETDTAFGAPSAEGIVDAPGGAGLGLHAITVVGVDLDRGLVLVDNSWSEAWGQKGRAWLSMRWLSLRAREAWGLALSDLPAPGPRPIWEMVVPGWFLDAAIPPQQLLA